jgi:hypothetical protein
VGGQAVLVDILAIYVLPVWGRGQRKRKRQTCFVVAHFEGFDREDDCSGDMRHSSSSFERDGPDIDFRGGSCRTFACALAVLVESVDIYALV